MKYLLAALLLFARPALYAQQHTRPHPGWLRSYPGNSLARLEDKDSLVVRFRWSGCFGGDSMRLVIIRKGSQYEAKYYKNKWYVIGKDSIHDSNFLTAMKMLTQVDLVQFIRFENELRQIRGESFCTTIAHYVVSSKYLTLERTDGNCHWDGFYKLTTAWFGKSS